MDELGFRRQIIEKMPHRRARSGHVRTVMMKAKQCCLSLWKWLRRLDRKGWRKLILRTVGGAVTVGIVTLAVLWFTLPNIDDPRAMFPAQSTVILDRNDVELYRLYSEEDRTYVTSAEISDFVKQATVAIEDQRFFSRSTCFDVIGFSRAVLSQVVPGLLVRSGGSTLTQQFAGNALVGRRRTVIRKVREMLLSCQLEQKYDKDQLLELYLNWIPYGPTAYGIEQASKLYFGASAKTLTLGQSALLAALPQRPTYFSPYGSHLKTTVDEHVTKGIQAGTITSAEQIEGADLSIGLIGAYIGSGTNVIYIGGRTDQVLRNMKEQGMITEQQEFSARDELQELTFSPLRKNIRAPHFVLDIERQAKEILKLEESDDGNLLEQGGFQITTTIDWKLQEIAEKVVSRYREDTAEVFGAHNIALVAMEPSTRDVLAYIGNADFDDDEHQGKIDMARAPRQPGSSFKPFAYLAAFEQGFAPASVVYDVPTEFGFDKPQNYDGKFWGPISMRQALGGSRNIPAIKAFFLGGGEDAVLSVARRAGITTPDLNKIAAQASNPDYEYGWPLALGAAEVPLVEMVQGYATLADQGSFKPMRTIIRITDRNGNILYAPKEESRTQVIDARLAASITSVLSDASVRPGELWQSSLAVTGVESAAKTGTSNKCLERDKKGLCTLRRPESTWTMGYTPNLIAGVWVGNATSQSLFEKADGLTTAAPIWRDFMGQAQKVIDRPKTAFAYPDGLAQPLISRLSGMLASECTPADLRASDVFPEDRVPTEEDTACVLLVVDKVTGLLASPECPVEAQEERAFFIPKSEAPERWPLWEKGVQEWVGKEMEKWNANEDHSGSLLKLGLAPTTKCDPALTPGRFEKPTVEILSPAPDELVSYPSFVPRVRISSVAPILQLVFEIDGKPLRTVTQAPFAGNSVRIPRTVDREGTHTLTVKITNKYFTTAEAEVQFRFE
ncbi:MAG: penicillin-binding protein [Candidatus Peribacteraceae bacterium]